MNYFPFASLSTSKEKTVNEESRNKFLGKCRICGETMTYVGGNVVLCKNEKCKGIKRTKKDKEGNDIVFYDSVFRLLDDKGVEIAEKLF